MSDNKLFLPQWWALFELASAGCPEPALRAFRDFVIGKGKGQEKILKASSADAAIRTADSVRYGSTKPTPAIIKLMENYRRTPQQMVAQNYAHIANNWPVVLVRRAGTEWPETVKDFLENVVPVGYVKYLYEFDDEAVDRIGG